MSALHKATQPCPACESPVEVPAAGSEGEKRLECPQCRFAFTVRVSPNRDTPGPDDPARATIASPPVPTPSRRRVWPALAAAVVLLALSAAAAAYWWRQTPVIPEPEGPREPDWVRADPTNLLPGDAESVTTIRLAALLDCPIGAIMTGGDYAFEPEPFADVWGIPPSDVYRIWQSNNATREWVFTVIQTLRPIDRDNLKQRLRLNDQSKLPGDVPCYRINVRLDPMSQFFFQMPKNPSPLFVCFPGERTLIVAHEAPLRAFLEHGGRPPLLGEPPTEPGRAAYLTIPPAMKAALDRLEVSGEAPLFTTTLDVGAAVAAVARYQALVSKDLPPRSTEDVRKMASSIGVALVTVQESGGAGVLSGRLAVVAPTEEGARDLEKWARSGVMAVVERYAALVNLAGVSVNLEIADVKRDYEAPVPKHRVRFRAHRDGNACLGVAGGEVGADAWASFRTTLQDSLHRIRSDAEIASRPDSPRLLGAALRAYATANRRFPAGTLIPDAGPRFNPPRDRLAWTAELLPHLGLTKVASRIDRARGWREGNNAKVASLTLPPFIHHEYADISRNFVLAPGVRVGTSHFVGVAGVGLDAADYLPEDTEAKKRGLFSYERATLVDEVTDGLGNTIALLQVPPTNLGCWLAGGGATVRGVPEAGSVRPFVCVGKGDSAGTIAVMADGKVRFISAKTSDRDFQALCTIAGGENVDIDRIAPEVRPAAEGSAP